MCDSFFLLSLFVTLYIFLHLTVMHSSTFEKGWVGMSACPLVVLACESLHVCTVCIWRCEHARFCVEVFYALYINFHSFIFIQCNAGVFILFSSRFYQKRNRAWRERQTDRQTDRQRQTDSTQRERQTDRQKKVMIMMMLLNVVAYISFCFNVTLNIIQSLKCRSSSCCCSCCCLKQHKQVSTRKPTTTISFLFQCSKMECLKSADSSHERNRIHGAYSVNVPSPSQGHQQSKNKLWTAQ